MNGFDNARLVEARSMAILEPFLRAQSDGKLVLFEKGSLARALQERMGDGIFNTRKGQTYSVEIKAEKKDRDRLFLEAFSNRNLEDRRNHYERGINPGWMFKLTASLLLYHLLAPDKLFVFDFFKLRRWAFGYGATRGRIWTHDLCKQKEHDQLNDTWGWCVPTDVLGHEVGYRLLNPLQLPLLYQMEAAE